MKIAFNYLNNFVPKVNSKPINNIGFRGGILGDTFHKNAPIKIDNLSENFDKPIKIIFSDIDGTMIGGDEYFLNRSLSSSVKDLEQKNIPLILSTGRSFDETYMFAAALPYTPDYYILEQGACILDKDLNLIYKDSISKEDSYKILDFYEEFSKKNPSVQMLANINESMYIIDSFSVSEDGKKDPFSFYSLLKRKIAKGQTPTKFLLFSSRPLEMSKMDKIRTKAMKEIDSDNISILIPDSHSFELINKSSSKGIAAKFIADRYGLSLENAVGIGDSENDISLISAIQEEGGVGVAMGNAQQKLINKAKFVTSSVYNSGFARMVSSVLKHNEQFE